MPESVSSESNSPGHMLSSPQLYMLSSPRGAPRDARVAGDPVAGTHNNRLWNMGPQHKRVYARLTTRYARGRRRALRHFHQEEDSSAAYSSAASTRSIAPAGCSSPMRARQSRSSPDGADEKNARAKRPASRSGDAARNSLSAGI